MPRLIGKQTNSGGYIALLLLAAAGTVGVMEYAGAVDIFPHIDIGNGYVGETSYKHQHRQLGALENRQENQQPVINPHTTDQQLMKRFEQPAKAQGDPNPVDRQPYTQPSQPSSLPNVD
ncbi:MAG TPA: hypothetical protein V6C57_28660 [Coleofasciculaceae cyanobacterium]